MTISRVDAIAARRRIRLFSIPVWLVCAGVLATVIGLGAFDYAYGQGQRTDRYPWMQATPATAATTDDGATWRGTGGARVPLAPDLAARGPLLVSAGEGTSYTRIYVAGPTPDATPAGAIPAGFVDEFGGAAVAFTRADSSVWVTSEGAWTLTFRPVDATPVGATTSGVGSEFLRYTGVAASATATSQGDGAFTIEVFTPDGHDVAVMDSDSVDTRFSWDPSRDVVLHVRTERPGTEWSLRFDEPQATP